MGGSNSANLNISSIASIIQCTPIDIENIVLVVEGRPKIPQAIEALYIARKLNKNLAAEEANKYRLEVERTADLDNETIPSDLSVVSELAGSTGDHQSPFTIGNRKPAETFTSQKEPELQTMLYLMSPEDFAELLQSLNFHPSDIDIILSLYTLADKRGFRQMDIRFVLISSAFLLATSPRDCLDFTFQLLDRTSTHIIEKTELLGVFTLLNDTLLYFGDKSLKLMQLIDLTDSIFTSAGKIDGLIYYPDFLDLICDHPIVELVLSPQFQGEVRNKLFDEETLSSMDLVV